MSKSPLYPFSMDEAVRSQNIGLWRESHKANIECRDAIEKAIRNGFDGSRLSSQTGKELCDNFGIDRISYVIANTIQHGDHDGRYSRENKEWASQFFINRPNKENDRTLDFLINSHPCCVDGLTNQVRRQIQSLNLFEKSHCKEPKDQDFEGKVLILKPSCLKDEFKTPDFQCFYATGGFGCNPDSLGRKVFGIFLKDGENASFDRCDFIGVLKDEYYPDFVKEKLEELNVPEPTQEMKM